MTTAWKDRVKQQVSVGGTGALTLGAAVSGFQALGATEDAKLLPFVGEDGTAWETFWGTYTHSSTSLARTSRTDSSTGAAINFSTSAIVYLDLIALSAQGMDIAAQSIIPGGRLTLTTAVPVTTADVTAAISVFYTPYIHNGIALWDGNRWQPVTFSETTLALGTLTSGLPHDVFGFLSAGVLATEKLAWTNGTTRATAVTLQDGRYCKSGAKDRLYLGTFYTTATTTTEDSIAKRYLFNMYNRMERKLEKIETTQHTYSTSAWRFWNNDSTQTMNFIDGLGTGVAVLAHIGQVATTAGSAAYTGIGLNIGTDGSSAQQGNATASTQLQGASGVEPAILGLNAAGIFEYSPGATTTYYVHKSRAVIMG